MAIGNGGELSARLNYSWMDDHRFNSNDSVFFIQESYGLFSARGNYTEPQGRWRVGFFADNITDEFYVQSALGSDTPGVVLSTAGRPQHFGGEFTYFFGARSGN